MFASSETMAAFTGFIPAAMSIAIDMATGAPKPASDSSSAPKQKAISIARIRSSSLIERMRSPSTLNHPVITVSRYTQRALTRIHRIGTMPYSAPSAAALSICSGGIRQISTARVTDMTRPTSDAFHAMTRKTPIKTKRVASGITATIADTARDPNTGSRI